MAKIIFEYTSQMLSNIQLQFTNIILIDRQIQETCSTESFICARGKKNAPGILISLHYIQSKYE